MRPYWHVVPLQLTTGRTLEPVPPVLQAVLGQELRTRDLVFKGDVLNLNGQPGGHGHLAVAEPLRRLGDGPHLVGGDFAVAG